jgi:uncharacterized protein (DUF2141 family)
VGAPHYARRDLGPPSFNAVAFHLAGGQLNLLITIRYL